MIGPYEPHHRSAVIGLLERSLLPEDAAEAAEIVDLLAGSTGFVAVDGDAPDGEVVGVALASPGHRDPTTGHLDLLAVDPGHRRHGHARALVEAVEQLLRARGLASVQVSGNAPTHAWPGVDVRYTPALCTLAALGYAHDRTAWNMTAELVEGSPALRETRAAQQRLADSHVVVRAATPADLPELLPVIAAEWGPAWVAEVERAVAGHGGCHLALRDGAPVGFAAWGGCRPSWFGPMGTLPAAAGLGIGGVLLRRCLRDQAERGLRQVQIGWVGPVAFYSGAAGARIERVFFLLTKPL
ncbi:GNAT family N-acetyltransferase [Catellatospora sp. KI3]|uniref:GNAT family N-acetyltransferase n=1 Tax=Catellatospora sp. KI3 TaxID=3041620 RepID=UPI00248308DA|nr:GNAT family N-acetyltransferase [Catellatospora sp. KI3]MDI1465807.1 GNAT family N-acetyltransferase [Catellatospora sp. KI3]